MTASPPPMAEDRFPDHRRAEAFLCQLDDDWYRHVAAVGPCLHVTLPSREPYEALVRAVAYQQSGAKAGDAILSRLLALYPDSGFPNPTQLLATDPEKQRDCGLSATKLNTVRGIAQATLDGVVPSRAEAHSLTDDALIERLVTLHGVGRWTVEMFLIYSLDRLDILPANDLGIRAGYGRLKGWGQAPTRNQMIEIGQAWSPFRTVAAWYLCRTPTRRRIQAQRSDSRRRSRPQSWM